MNVFVTGGAGYIGSHVVRLLLASGHHVRVFDNLSEGHEAALPSGALYKGDLMDDDRLVRGLTERYDCVMHFAANCYVGESMTDPEKYYFNNIVGGLRLLSAMRRAGCKRLVFSSTAATYGNPIKTPISEDHPTQPINAYGQTKLDFEHAMAYFASAYGIGYVALRYFNAAGAAPDGTLGEDHDPEPHLIPVILKTALGQLHEVKVFGVDYPTPDGTCIRDYVHVNDLAEAHILAMHSIEPGKGRIYNLGNGSGYSVRQVIDAAKRITGRQIPVTEGPRRAGDPAVLVASSEKIVRELGWRPKYPAIETIIETAWKWHKSHQDGYDD
jgi:UDP-glucose-4-epimerase GalE